MKKILIALVAVLLMCPMVLAKDFSFTWDANIESSMAGYAIFQRINDGAYDYNAPIDPDCTIVDGGCYTDPANKVNEYTISDINVGIPAVANFTAVFNRVAQSVDFSWTYTESPPVTYSFVARARDTEGLWSGDSNEVSYTFDLGVTHWKLYQSEIQGGPYAEILDIPWDGTSDLGASLPAETLAPGSTYYFTVVGFTVDNIFSPNSNEVQIDRRPPTKVINLKITLIP